MAERFGIVAIKNAIVTLLGTTNVSELNNGLSMSVKQVVTLRPDPEIVIPETMFPTVNVWIGDSVDVFRGASKRKEVVCSCNIYAYVKKWGSVDNSIDDIQQLADNIRYIIDANTSFPSVNNGYIKTTGVSFDYGGNNSGFISKATISLEIIRELN